MSATKLSASLVLTAGLITAGLFAEAAPAKSIHYSDSAKVPPGSTPEGAVYTFMDPADPAVTDLAQFGFKAIEQIGGRLVLETTRELATKETQLAVATLHLKDMELPKPVAGKPTITAVRRTSVLIRDPRNAPDGADAAALNKIDTQLKDGESPDKMIVQKIEQAGNAVVDSHFIRRQHHLGLFRRLVGGVDAGK